MKNKLFKSVALFLAVIPLFLTGCGSLSVLSFSNGFSAYLGDGNVTPGYTQTLNYSVYYSDSEYFPKDDSIDDNVTIQFLDGNYTSTLTTIQIMPNNLESLAFIDTSSDISALVSGEGIIKLTTNFTITSVFTEGETEYRHDDFIYTEVYFATKKHSFAPIFAKSYSSYTIASYANGVYFFYVSDAQTETLYSSNSYTIKTRNNAYTFDEPTPDKINDKEWSSDTIDYKFRTIIDNTQLLFALRNVTIDTESSFNLPTVSPAYKEYKTLRVLNGANTEDTINVAYNGTALNEEKIKVSNLNYAINDTSAQGETKFVSVQREASSNIPNMHLPVVFAEPLIFYQSFVKMGALVFKINSVNV